MTSKAFGVPSICPNDNLMSGDLRDIRPFEFENWAVIAWASVMLSWTPEASWKLAGGRASRASEHHRITFA